MGIETAIQLFGGIGIFLFAIKLISDSLQLLAGDRMRHFIGILTRTPVQGVLVGAGVTILIQSSSATTVMTVSFVDAGLMGLKQAIGVIMGANIGTTTTGQILAFKAADFAYFFIIAGVLLSFFCKGKRQRFVGNGLIGFGLLFIGMQTMGDAMSFLRDRADIFVAFSHNPLLGLAAGTLLTFLVQSSSATVGLTIALGMQGLLTLEAAIPIVLGDNVGTTVTAVLASLGTNRAAKQACAAHVLFNVIGVLIFLPLMPFYIDFIRASSADVSHQIANAHTLFNVCTTLAFLPMVSVFANVIRRLIPAPEQPDPDGVRYLDERLIGVAPVMAAEAVRNECVRMGEVTIAIMEAMQETLFEEKNRQADVLALDSRLDSMRKAVVRYGEDVLRAGLSEEGAERLRTSLACAGDMERIGDSARRIISLHELEGETLFPTESREEVAAMYSHCREAIRQAIGLFIESGAPDNEKRKICPVHVDRLASLVREMEANMRMSHVQHLNEDDHRYGSLVYIDALAIIEQMAYRARHMGLLIRKSNERILLHHEAMA